MRKYSLFTAICLTFIIFSLCQAHPSFRWPTFHAPDEHFIKNKLLETSRCPSGQARLVSPSFKLNINPYFCNTFCPNTWQWVGKNNDQCHDINDYRFQRYEITYHTTDPNNVEYSVVTGYYGKSADSNPVLQITMTTQAGEHWLCAQVSKQSNTVFCTNDI